MGSILNSKKSIWIDIFLILHSIVHFLFRKHKNSEFNKLFNEKYFIDNYSKRC